MTNPAYTFAATTANGIPMLFVWDPDKQTIRYYDRRYAGQPGFTEHGQDCGPALCADSFQPDATFGIRGWHGVDVWDLDARTVRLVGTWLMLSGFLPATPTADAPADCPAPHDHARTGHWCNMTGDMR